MYIKKLATIFVVLLFFSTVAIHMVSAQTETPTPASSDNSSTVKALNDKIAELEKKVSDLRSQGDSLSSQIAVMDNQITLTEARIDSTKQEMEQVTTDIDSASKRMKNLEGSLSDVTKVLINRIVATYQVGETSPMELLLSSGDISDFFERANYLRIVQAHDKQLLYDTQQAKNDYANQKAIFEDKKKKIESLQTQLEDYTKQLDAQKEDKKKLLAETLGNEANYQKLLSQAKAQLAGFSRFATSQGGASLLSGQTSCDDWGCYYNQRDAQWGGNSLNGTQYTLASDGCLITSMAMMFTHYGHRDVTPQTINGNSNNFASYYPAYLKYAIAANGASASRVGASLSDISSGPLVVGISYGNGGTHFVVMVKKDADGSYIMNDPFVEGGHNVKFTDHYSLGSIFEVSRVVM